MDQRRSEGDAIIVFADGASRGNPGPGGWGAIVAFPEGNVVELGGAEPYTTNNRMELLGAIAALERVAGRTDPVLVHTDSSYVIQGISSWIHNWRKRGWKTVQGGDVINRDLWERLSAVAGKHVRWQHVRGHAGIPGNERVDTIASGLADHKFVDLFNGPRAAYEVDLTAGVGANAAPKRPKSSSSSKSSGRAYSYLSLVGGVLQRHKTWPECEARVKGVAGARFKKAMSPEDEGTIARSWGVSL